MKPFYVAYFHPKEERWKWEEFQRYGDAMERRDNLIRIGWEAQIIDNNPDITERKERGYTILLEDFCYL